MEATSLDPEILGGELVFAGTRVPVSPGQHGAGRVEHGGKAMDESKPSEQVETVLEDADDLAAVARRRGEPTLAHEEVVAALKEVRNAEIASEPRSWKSAQKQRLADEIRDAVTKKEHGG
jgi:hypothetical protein